MLTPLRRRSGSPWPPSAKTEHRTRGRVIEGRAKNPASRTSTLSGRQRLAKALKGPVADLLG